ncbi:cytochrome c [Mesorhizobium australicum]|uniref:Cytochrome c, mono-and diheme variants n=1 Tax=Mesorhizobium australicum TaxID=536018 RepID=A0A1X7NWE8_9HYPH|nr:cytochrome c [Mesorhizobium australicum]SMH42094.1 Cytochrome c, mono-and diheme variants [Mesorhizobium australicum]
MAGTVRKFAIGAALLAVAGGAAFWFLTVPERIPEAEIAALAPGDAARGERIFYAGGCASCHAAAQSDPVQPPRLSGGLRLVTDFGTFVAPNISQHPTDGIGNWSLADLANAMQKGVSPDGRHYYPAFPYASYARMKLADIADLHAFMKTLPAVEGKAPGNELGFPFNISRGIGLWKLVNLSPAPVLSLPGASEQVLAGQYLVEGPGHCGECHTPRDVTGGIDKTQWLAGAAAAEGDGVVPNITPQSAAIGEWSPSDIAEYLKSGFTPDFDSAGGAMAAVVKNIGHLSDDDRAAIAAYLKAVPGRANGYPAPR